MLRPAAWIGRIPFRSTRYRRALTLFEVVLSISLIAMLLTAILTFFWQSAEVRKQAALEADRTQVARQVLERLASELRGCLGMEQIGFPVEQRLIGTRRSITFLTTGVPDESQYKFYRASEKPPPARHDLRLVTYALWVDPENQTDEGEPIVGGILRTERTTLNQFVIEENDPNKERTDLWSHELGYVEFRYFDGIEWDTKWDITEGNSLPQLVQITVGYDSITNYELSDDDLQEQSLSDDKPPVPGRYSTIVRIPAADRFFSSRIQRVGKQMSDQLGVEGAK